MAGSKEAPVDLCIESAACRAALDEAVSKFADLVAATPAPLIRRRIKQGQIDKVSVEQPPEQPSK